MNEQELKNLITSSYEAATPDVLDKIKQNCDEIEQLDGVIDFKESKKRKISWRRATAMAASIALVFFAGFVAASMILPGNTSEDNKTAVTKTASKDIASVYLDVNPSLQLKIDQDMNVSACKAQGQEGQALIDSMDLQGASMEVALNAIVGSLYMNGYITEESCAILISVDSKDAAVIKDITEDMNSILQGKKVNCDLIIQEVNSKELKTLAKDNKVSVGKVGFVNRIIADSDLYSDQDMSTLCQYSILDLNNIFKGLSEDTTNKAIHVYHLGSLVDQQGDGASNTASNGASAAQDVVNNTTDAANGLVNNTTDAANDIVNNSTNQANGLINNVFDQANKTINNTTDKINNKINKTLTK